MALITTSRDISLFRVINKELLNNIIQQEVDYYKINLYETKTNIYGEAPKVKTYYNPIRLTCLITREDINNDTSNFGVDVKQGVTFGFLRDGILDEKNLIPEIGDLVNWNEQYYEVDGININQFVSGKSDLTSKDVGPEFGASWSYLCKSHLTRVEKLIIVNS